MLLDQLVEATMQLLLQIQPASIQPICVAEQRKHAKNTEQMEQKPTQQTPPDDWTKDAASA